MALKLPSIGRRSPQRIPGPDIMAPVKEAQAKAAKIQAISSGVLALGGMAKRYVDRVDRQEVRDATLAVHKADMEFRRANEGAEEFDVMAVDDENFINIADGLGYEDPEAPVPAHQVYPNWRKKNYEDAIEKAASGISGADAKDAFLQEHGAKGETQFTDDFVKSTKRQIKYHADQTIRSVEESLKDKDFTTARIVVDSSEMSSERKKVANDDINLREQNDYFQETIEKRDISVMENALKQLRENAPNTSELNADKQKVLANQLRTAIGVEKNAIRAGANSQLKLQANNLKNRIEDVWNNEITDLETMGKEMNNLQLKNPVLVQEAEWTLNNQPLVSAVLLEGPEEQAAIYESFRANTGGDLEKSYLVDKLGKAIANSNRAFQTDAMKQANDTGLIALEPIDYSSPESIGVSFAKRSKQAITTRDRHQAFTGYLTKAEMATFGNRIENASIDEQLVMFGSISESLGDYAPPLYEQLKKYNVAGTAALAGQLMAQGPGFRTTAENILKGAELRRTNTITQLEVKEADLDPVITQLFGPMFAGNRKHQTLMADAFKDVWAVTKDTDATFEQLTGGAIDYKGSIIQAPAPGVGGWKYEFHVRDIDPAWWAGENMQAYGYTPEQVRNNVVDGTFMQLGVGAGANNLVTADGSIVTTPDGITPLVFSIDMSEPTIGARDAKHTEGLRKAFDEKKKAKKANRAAEIQKAWGEVGIL